MWLIEQFSWCWYDSWKSRMFALLNWHIVVFAVVCASSSHAQWSKPPGHSKPVVEGLLRAVGTRSGTVGRQSARDWWTAAGRRGQCQWHGQRRTYTSSAGHCSVRLRQCTVSAAKPSRCQFAASLAETSCFFWCCFHCIPYGDHFCEICLFPIITPTILRVNNLIIVINRRQFVTKLIFLISPNHFVLQCFDTVC